MQNYQLGINEVVLYKNEVTLLQDGKKGKDKTKTELLLTNDNFVFINKTKKLFQKELVNTIIIPIESMKVYNNMPYMVKKNTLIELYTKNGEYFLEFEKKKQAKDFFDKTMRVASGYSKFVRGVKKVSKEIKDTNKALDIDIIGATKKTLDFAADVAIDFSEQPKKSKTQLISSVAKVFKKRKSQNNLQIEQKSPDEQTKLLEDINSYTEKNT